MLQGFRKEALAVLKRVAPASARLRRAPASLAVALREGGSVSGSRRAKPLEQKSVPLRDLALTRKVDRDRHNNRHRLAIQHGWQVFPLPHSVKRGLIEQRNRVHDFRVY